MLPFIRAKILKNEIFDLLPKTDEQPDSFHTMLTEKQAWPIPAELAVIVDVAANMPTKLWIDKKTDDPLDPLNKLDYPLDDLDCLVVCGQATICYNLLQYLWCVLREDDNSWINPGMEDIFNNTMKEWEKLMNDPLSLLKDRKLKSEVKDLMDHAKKLQTLQDEKAET